MYVNQNSVSESKLTRLDSETTHSIPGSCFFLHHLIYDNIVCASCLCKCIYMYKWLGVCQ